MKMFKDKIIFIVRHGERADMIENIALEYLKCGKYDTELTSLGKTDAMKVGEMIRKYLKTAENNTGHNKEFFLTPNSTKIISSPFVRTLMTANHLIQGLDVQLPITIENGISEHLNKKWYPDPPEKFLVYLKEKESKERLYLNSQIREQEFSQGFVTKMPKHPETHAESFERLHESFKMLIRHYLEFQDYKILIMVTHFYPLQVFSKIFHSEDEEIPLEYCLTFAYRFTTHDKKMKFLSKIYPLH
jgi:broad specificity phosphatase PhoE